MSRDELAALEERVFSQLRSFRWRDEFIADWETTSPLKAGTCAAY